MTIKINPKEIRHVGLIEWMKQNYTQLSKKQIFEISVKYISIAYLRNGHAHIEITNELLKEYEEGGCHEEN